MAATRTSAKKTSRERARQKRAELDAARARRDEQIEDAAATFFDADDARAAVLEQLEEIDRTRGLAVATLVDLKESNQRIAQLLDIPTAEVRRLRDLVEEASGSDGESAAIGNDSIRADVTDEDSAGGTDNGTPADEGTGYYDHAA